MVAQRFNALGRDKNWGKIVEMWERDREKERRIRGEKHKPREERDEDKMARLRREVVGMKERYQRHFSV